MEQNDVSELQNYLDGHRFRELRSRLMKMNEADIAEFLEELDHNQKVLIFRMLPRFTSRDKFR